MKSTRRAFLGSLAVAAVPAVSVAVPVPETLEDRVQRLKGELEDALTEKWSSKIEGVWAPYGNHALFFMEVIEPEDGRVA